MSLFINNLARRGKAITIYDRDEKIINGHGTEVFSNIRTDRGIVTTPNGVTVFDSTNTNREVTHKICMPYRDDIGAEQWIKIGVSTKRVKILATINKCESDSVLILLCTERGEDVRLVNSA